MQTFQMSNCMWSTLFCHEKILIKT